MKKEEIIEQLFRIAEPEPWEPEITSKAREALYSAIDAIELTDAEEKYLKNDIKETRKAYRQIRVTPTASVCKKNLVDVIGEPAMLEQTAEECTELAQACLKYARYLRGENKVYKPIHTIRANFHEELADVSICVDEMISHHFVDVEKVRACEKFKRERMQKRLAEDTN